MINYKLNRSFKPKWNKMNKFLLSILFIVSACNAQEGQRSGLGFSNIASGLGSYLGNRAIEREAAARIARQKAEEELALLNAQKEAILKERLELIVEAGKGLWWLTSNIVKGSYRIVSYGVRGSYKIVTQSGKFAIEITKDIANTTAEAFTDAELVAQKINAGDKKAIRGSVGIAAIILFAAYKYNQSKKPAHPKPDGYNPYAHAHYGSGSASFSQPYYSQAPNASAPEQDEPGSGPEGQSFIPGGHTDN
jgi:hypothetical protein